MNSNESQTSSFKAGTLLIQENELSRKMFIIKSGKVRVFKTYMNQRITLAILGEGEVFGELSFFDAERRSASVEALTDLVAIVVDGEKATQQIATLPEWVLPIFRTVFHRFREADSKITVLQSMNEYQKKSFKTDTVGKTVYLELLRFIKTFEILFDRESQGGVTPKSELMLKELDEVLGKRFIGLKVFWRLLKEYDFIDHTAEEQKGEVLLHKQSLAIWKTYLSKEVESDRLLLLSHASIALLRRMVGFIQASQPGTQNTPSGPMTIRTSDISMETLPLYPDAIKELTGKNLLTMTNNTFGVDPAEICHLYMFQSILKNFDHTIVTLD